MRKTGRKFFTSRLRIFTAFSLECLLILPNILCECEEVYILPNGVELLNLQAQDVFPPELYDVFLRSSNVVTSSFFKKKTILFGIIKIELLSQFTEEMNSTFKGRLHFTIDGRDDIPDIKALKGQVQ